MQISTVTFVCSLSLFLEDSLSVSLARSLSLSLSHSYFGKMLIFFFSFWLPFFWSCSLRCRENCSHFLWNHGHTHKHAYTFFLPLSWCLFIHKSIISLYSTWENGENFNLKAKRAAADFQRLPLSLFPHASSSFSLPSPFLCPHMQFYHHCPQWADTVSNCQGRKRAHVSMWACKKGCDLWSWCSSLTMLSHILHVHGRVHRHTYTFKPILQ